MDYGDLKFMSLVDESKWLINRIDTMSNALRDELTTGLSRYDEMGKNETKRLRGRRNNILTALGIGITIVLGIYTVDKLEESIFYSVLFGLLILGLGIYIFFNFFVLKMENFFVLLHNAILQSETQIAFSQGYFISQTANPQILTYEQLWNWFVMTQALGGAMYIPPTTILLSKKGKLFNPTIEELVVSEGKKTIGLLTDFEKSTKNLKRENYLPKITLSFIDNSLKSFKELKKLDDEKEESHGA